MIVDAADRLYQLIQQWCDAADQPKAHKALRQIALLTACIPLRGQFGDADAQQVVQWLQDNHPNAYLWAIGRKWVGHPAIVWGIARSHKQD